MSMYLPKKKKIKRKPKGNIIKWVIVLVIGFFLRFPLILEQFKLEQKPTKKPKPEFFLAQAPMAEAKKAIKEAKPELSIRTFSLSSKQIDDLKQRLGIISTDKPAEILRKIYLGLYSGEKKKESGTSGTFDIIYQLGKNVTKSPEEVLDLAKPEEKRKPKGDCDEITRTAYLIAAKSGIKNLVMVEMTWIKDGKQEGHVALVLMPEKAGNKPLLFDFTYQYNAIPLDSTNLELEIKKKYEKQGMQEFKVSRQLKTLEEVEASHYDQVGSYYLKNKNWALAAEAYERTVKLVPREFRYNLNLAVAYQNLKRYADALIYYKKASELEEGKNDANVYNGLGFVHINLGQEDEAIAALKEALRLTPNRILKETIVKNLAAALHGKGIHIFNNGVKISKVKKDYQTSEKMFTDALNFLNEANTYDPNREHLQDDIKTIESSLEKLKAIQNR